MCCKLILKKYPFQFCFFNVLKRINWSLINIKNKYLVINRRSSLDYGKAIAVLVPTTRFTEKFIKLKLQNPLPSPNKNLFLCFHTIFCFSWKFHIFFFFFWKCIKRSSTDNTNHFIINFVFIRMFIKIRYFFIFN